MNFFGFGKKEEPAANAKGAQQGKPGANKGARTDDDLVKKTNNNFDASNRNS
jgi:hypothetical protein